MKKPGREEKKGIGREKEFDFYWGRGKTVKKPGREEKKGKYNIKRNRERVRFLLGKGKNCKKTRKRRKERDRKREIVRFLLGKGKNCKKPEREEKKGKYNGIMI